MSGPDIDGLDQGAGGWDDGDVVRTSSEVGGSDGREGPGDCEPSGKGSLIILSRLSVTNDQR